MSAGLNIQSVYYPESDGKPMGETDWHRRAIIRLIVMLEHRYRGQKVYVSGDLLVYYEEGNPKKFLVPDVFVVKDLLQQDRRIYRMWQERKPPNAIIEVTSRKTRKKDATEKPKLYAQLGVKEYFLFDPDADYLDPPLQGFRLGRSKYRRIVADADGRLLCQELGLRLGRDETGEIQLFDVESGARLLTGEEEAALAKHEAAQVKHEAAQVKQEAARLREENQQLRAELSRRKSSSK